MSFDPDEDVTLNGAKMSLRSAVAKVMALPPEPAVVPVEPQEQGAANLATGDSTVLIAESDCMP